MCQWGANNITCAGYRMRSAKLTNKQTNKSHRSVTTTPLSVFFGYSDRGFCGDGRPSSSVSDFLRNSWAFLNFKLRQFLRKKQGIIFGSFENYPLGEMQSLKSSLKSSKTFYSPWPRPCIVLCTYTVCV